MNFWGYDTDERFIGAVKFGKDVEVTDPCYTPDLGCGYTAHDFEPGAYNAYIMMNEDGDRVAELIVYNSEYDTDARKRKIHWEYDGCGIAVDSGQAGFFDEDYYIEGKKIDDAEDGKDFDKMKGFYKDCCNLTLSREPYGVLANGLGTVSSSGYGDGVYDLLTVKNATGNVIAAKILFIDLDEENDWDDDEDEDECEEEEENDE